MLRIVNHFSTIQGEGKNAGEPVHLIRLYGCNLACPFCDTKYALFPEGKPREITPELLAVEIGKNPSRPMLWTGGEPMLQSWEVVRTIDCLGESINYLETNGTILDAELTVFDFIEFSPKNVDTAKKVTRFVNNSLPPKTFEIKIVTNLDDIGVDMLNMATTIMPLTTGDKSKDELTRMRVWSYCIEHNIRYSPRLHVELESCQYA